MISSLRIALSVRAKLRVIVILLSIGMVVVGGIAAHALARTQSVTEGVVSQTAALSLLQSADMAHEGLQSLVYEALRLNPQDRRGAERVRKGVAEQSQAIHDSMSRLKLNGLDADVRSALAAAGPLADRYVEMAQNAARTASVDRPDAVAMLPDFDKAFEELQHSFDKQISLLRQRNESSLARAETVEMQANMMVAAASVLGLVFTAALVGWVGYSIRASLDRVAGVASAVVASGDLGRRAAIEVDDEVGRLAGVVNSMADKLQNMLKQALDDSEQHRFGRELTDALDMADSEPETYRVIQRAMAAVSPDHPMELLVSDSSQAVLQRAAEHPSAGAPGCDVDSPFHCQAVRRGNSVTFLDSNALCACPHLRGRPGALEAISAVCVPLHFMGRALGVLHTTGPAQQPIQPHQLTQLATIGAQAASRIGVVRAFERTQLQAATDAATGLANRRALEAAIAELLGKKRHFALVMADLDRFKMLNDTYGHLVGDDALRLFADTMKKSVRDLDTVARWGGEEFAILLPGCNAREGADWAARARAALAMALASAKVPKFTVSLGIADSTMAERMDDLLRIADEALYRSKEQGRDRATIGRALAANEFSTRQRSEHEERIDVTRLNDVSVA